MVVTETVTEDRIMSASTKLSTSVKALSCLARAPLSAKTSSEIAISTGVNASKLRRLLSLLAKQGIVRTIKGKTGGFQLNKKCNDIHLQEIYCAIEDRKAFHLDVHNGELSDNQMTGNINKFFSTLFSDIQIDIEAKMKNITLQDIINKS